MKKILSAILLSLLLVTQVGATCVTLSNNSTCLSGDGAISGAPNGATRYDTDTKLGYRKIAGSWVLDPDIVNSGKAGGQSLAFDTASGATTGYLTSTYHATKGSYGLTADSNIQVKESTKQLYLGTDHTTFDGWLPGQTYNQIIGDSINGYNGIVVTNTNTGTAARAMFSAFAQDGSSGIDVVAYGVNNNTSHTWSADSAAVYAESQSTGGLCLAHGGAYPIHLITNDTKRWAVGGSAVSLTSANGNISLQEVPTAGVNGAGGGFLSVDGTFPQTSPASGSWVGYRNNITIPSTHTDIAFIANRNNLVGGGTGGAQALVASWSENGVISTATSLKFRGDVSYAPTSAMGAFSQAYGASTTGVNFGHVFSAEGSAFANVGGFGKAVTSADGFNIGVLGLGNNAGAGTGTAGYFSLSTADPVGVDVALLADNGAVAAPIFIARDNGSTVFEVADGGTINLGGATNKSSFSPAGRMTMAGTARITKIINLGIDGLGTGATAPTVARVGNFYGYKFSVNDDGYIRSFEMPYDWDTTTDASVKIHWACNNTTADKVIKFQLDYSAIAHGAENIDAATTTLDTGDLAVPTTAYRLSEASITVPAASLAHDDNIGMVVKRIAASGGAGVVPDDEPIIISLEVTYTANSLGESL